MFKFALSALAICAFYSNLLCAKDHLYTVNNKSYESYYKDKGKTATLVFIIHDWDGIGEYEVKRAEMLANLGYSVFAIDMFGKGIRPKDDKDKKILTSELYGDRKKMRQLINAGIEEARKLGLNTNNAVMLGYCFGGSAALELARSGAMMRGYVSFHGGLATPQGQDYSKVKSPLLIIHGTADSVVSMDEFARLAVLLEQSKVPHEMISYSGAPHAFSVFNSPAYRKDADMKSWSRLTAFLKE
ncbi:MAG: dienelactone hydrolase family protein [Oligoflexales bacterium]|nr:dienelactone hydrolase family protein [Oligoflexales bacterium]